MKDGAKIDKCEIFLTLPSKEHTSKAAHEPWENPFVMAEPHCDGESLCDEETVTT